MVGVFGACASGQINTIRPFAGNAALGPGFAGDTGAATAAQLDAPISLAVDAAGTVYIGDFNNARVRAVSPDGIITTVTGTGLAGYSGDGSAAITAQIAKPTGLAVDSAGNIYIADSPNNRIRKITNGFISTVAGGAPGAGGDNGPATLAQLNFPTAVAVDSSGNLYIADTGNHRIRKVSGGIITTFAGSTLGFGGGTTTPALAQFFSPQGVAVDAQGAVYVSDTGNNIVRKISNGQVVTVAGTGTAGYGGDRGPATSALLNAPGALAIDPAGSVYIADFANHAIRKLSGTSISTVAGTGTAGFSGDGGPAAAARLNGPLGVALDSAGGTTYIADSQNAVVRAITNPIVSGVIPHFAAGGGYSTGIFIINKTAVASPFTVSFFNDAGTAIAVPVSGVSAPALTVTDTVAALGTTYFELGDIASATLLSGSATIQATSNLVFQALFRRKAASGTFYEATVSSATGTFAFETGFDATTFATNGAQIYTGLAIANLDTSSTATVTCVARDNTGTLIANGITIPVIRPSGHWADYVFPALLTKRGTLDCTSTARVGVTALRFLGAEAVSTLPVILK